MRKSSSNSFEKIVKGDFNKIKFDLRGVNFKEVPRVRLKLEDTEIAVTKNQREYIKNEDTYFVPKIEEEKQVSADTVYKEEEEEEKSSFRLEGKNEETPIFGNFVKKIEKYEIKEEEEIKEEFNDEIMLGSMLERLDQAVSSIKMVENHIRGINSKLGKIENIVEMRIQRYNEKVEKLYDDDFEEETDFLVKNTKVVHSGNLRPLPIFHKPKPRNPVFSKVGRDEMEEGKVMFRRPFN